MLNDDPFSLFKDLLSGDKADTFTLLKKTIPVVVFAGTKKMLIAFEVHEFWMTQVQVVTRGPGNQVATENHVVITGVNYNVDVRKANNVTGEGLLIDRGSDVQPSLDQANDLFNDKSSKIARNFDVPSDNNVNLLGINISDIQAIVAGLFALKR